MDIGLRIAQYRVEKGWNQSDLAKAVGIDQSTVSKIERGVSKANMETLSKFAKVLGVNLTALVDDGIVEEVKDQRIQALSAKLAELEEQLRKSKYETLPTFEMHDEERKLLADIRSSKIPNLVKNLRIALIAAPQLLEETLAALSPQFPLSDATAKNPKKPRRK